MLQLDPNALHAVYAVCACLAWIATMQAVRTYRKSRLR